MYPYPIILGLDLYTLLIIVGIVAAIALFRVLSDARKLPAAPFNFFLLVCIAAIATGFGAATLFQSVYNYLESGVWEWQGMTFLGGLVGGVAFFFLLYFVLGRFVFRERQHIRYFYPLVCRAIPCIALAHAFGRLGCLCAGCCYGRISERFGLSMLIDGVWQKRVPTQLYEAIFLFALCAVLVVLLIRRRGEGYAPAVYLVAYGVWRFCIEYLRDDPRGASGISFLTPSQLTSVLLVACGIVLIVVYRVRFARKTGEEPHEPQ